MSDDALREAGAILPGEAAPDRSVDTITARSYGHPVLDGRTVVRLVPGALGEAEDLSMEFLGFAAEAAPVVVGHGRREALGFPAWALVNDPANGRHALALVKDMEKLARVAKSKPGNAKDGYDALAKRLGRAAPHFLPTFWEQVGRAFLAAENPKAAGTCFTAARQAEQVHGLPVDEDRLRDVHLEFAFAGALTAKALSEYARQVAQRRPAVEAYELVRTLAVRRVAGGLPPYVGMADDLKRLAKAAGLTPDAEAETVIGELLGYPAVAKSHEGFWKAYRPALLRLARRDPATRGRLLALLPDPPGYGADATDTWLQLLDEAGALDALRSPATAPEPARPVGGVAGWVQRFVDHRNRGWRRGGRIPRWNTLFAELIGTVRDELVASGGELRLGLDSYWFADLDLLDIAVAAGVPLKTAAAGQRRGARFNVNAWLGGSEETRRDLAAVAADERFLPFLVAGLRENLGGRRGGDSDRRRQEAWRQRATQRLAPAGLRTAATVWLDTVREKLGAAPTLPTLADALDEVAPLWTYDGVSLHPDVFGALAGADVAEALARSLRGGHPAELGWPEHDAAYTALGQAQELDAWPDLVLNGPDRAIVLGPDGVLLEHAFRTPAGVKLSSYDRLRANAWVDGELRVSWSTGRYWSGRPTEVLETRGWYSSRVSGGLPLPGGGRTTGGRPLHVGDAGDPEDHRVISDGSAYWRYERPDDPAKGPAWREYDPATGTPGRRSLPAFFDVELADGDVLDVAASFLRPAPEAFVNSPTGWRDGLVGWRLIRHADGTCTGTGIDGRSVRWAPVEPEGHGAFLGAFRLPGDDQPRAVTYQGDGSTFGRVAPGMTVTLWDAEGRQPVARWSTGPGLPEPAFWHALRPRDEAGSKALRSVDAAQARRLLAACADAAADDLLPAARGAVADLLAEITDERLAEAVAWSVAGAEQTRRLQRQVARLLAERDDPSAAESVAPSAGAHVSELDIQRVVADLDGGRRNYAYAASQSVTGTLDQIAWTTAFVSGGEATLADMPVGDPTWARLLPWPGAVVVRAASPFTSDADRTALAALLRQLSGLRQAGADARLRVLTVRCADGVVDSGGGAVLDTGASTFVIMRGPHQYYSDRTTWERIAIEVSATGEFRVPAGVFVTSAHPLTGWGDADRLATAADLVERHGAAPLPVAGQDTVAAATGISRAEAALLLAALPRLTSYEANFLTAQERALLGHKSETLRVARAALRQMPAPDRLALLDAAMPADPADLWRAGPDADGLARRWIERFGAVIPIPDELLAAAGRVLMSNDANPLRTLVRPLPHDWLHTDGVSTADGWRVTTTAAEGEPFEGSHLTGVSILLPWLAYRLPAGDPIRAALPTAYGLVRERLRNDKLLVGAVSVEHGQVPPGMPALVEGSQWDTHSCYHLRPAALTGADDPALAFMDSWVTRSLRLLLDERFAATMAAIEAETLPAGRYPHDPTLTVPDLVEAVAAEYGLDADAAAYYLQLLALPDPTDKRVVEWNGWKAARLTAARKALTATDLVVEAKRERAGRSLFLPGGWLPLKAPDLPIEAWKTGFGADGSLPGGQVLVTTPVPQLFRAAWARVASGDRPRYQSLSEAR
ncbi:hypothetical protein [Luedemannella helvata]|uniref:DNA-binding protein n=1 Tax=Luedemannella helvata TaxID=349315 RepID=A0ABP4VYE7_9ACTN